jgi:hypothetical protein
MATAVSRAFLQAAVRATPAWLTGTHPWGPALPVAPAAPGTEGEAKGGIETQKVVVGIAEEVKQHLQKQGGWARRVGWPQSTAHPQGTLPRLCSSWTPSD